MGNMGKCVLGFLPALLATVAFLTSSASNYYCETIQFIPNSNITTEDDGSSPVLKFGLFGYRKIASATFADPGDIVNEVASSINGGGSAIQAISTDCRSYEGFEGLEYDASWKTARAFAVFGTILGGLATAMLWTVPCCFRRVSSSSYKKFGILAFLILLPLFQGLTLLILKSELCLDNPFFIEFPNIGERYSEQSKCMMSGGGRASIVSIIFYVFVAISMVVLGLPEATSRSKNNGLETQQVTYIKETNPETGVSTVSEIGIVKGTYVQP